MRMPHGEAILRGKAGKKCGVIDLARKVFADGMIQLTHAKAQRRKERTIANLKLQIETHCHNSHFQFAI